MPKPTPQPTPRPKAGPKFPNLEDLRTGRFHNNPLSSSPSRFLFPFIFRGISDLFVPPPANEGEYDINKLFHNTIENSKNAKYSQLLPSHTYIC